MKKQEKNDVQKALEIIYSSQTQNQAMVRLKLFFGEKPVKLNISCWVAYNNLPKI